MIHCCNLHRCYSEFRGESEYRNRYQQFKATRVESICSQSEIANPNSSQSVNQICCCCNCCCSRWEEHSEAYVKRDFTNNFRYFCSNQLNRVLPQFSSMNPSSGNSRMVIDFGQLPVWVDLSSHEQHVRAANSKKLFSGSVDWSCGNSSSNSKTSKASTTAHSDSPCKAPHVLTKSAEMRELYAAIHTRLHSHLCKDGIGCKENSTEISDGTDTLCAAGKDTTSARFLPAGVHDDEATVFKYASISNTTESTDLVFKMEDTSEVSELVVSLSAGDMAEVNGHQPAAFSKTASISTAEHETAEAMYAA